MRHRPCRVEGRKDETHSNKTRAELKGWLVKRWTLPCNDNRSKVPRCHIRFLLYVLISNPPVEHCNEATRTALTAPLP